MVMLDDESWRLLLLAAITLYSWHSGGGANVIQQNW